MLRRAFLRLLSIGAATAAAPITLLTEKPVPADLIELPILDFRLGPVLYAYEGDVLYIGKRGVPGQIALDDNDNPIGIHLAYDGHIAIMGHTG